MAGRSASFTVSGFVHGWVLGWVALVSPAIREQPKSAYDLAIKPHEKRIVWYNLRDRLPDVAPSEKPADARPPRALKKFEQNLVSGEKDDRRPPQMISIPAPEIETPKVLPLPNVVAARPGRAGRLFVPPPEKKANAPTPALPDAPRVASAIDPGQVPFASSTPRPQPRPFTPPPSSAQSNTTAALPEAPRVQQSADKAQLPYASSIPRPQPRPFTPPPAAAQPRIALALPDAPQVASVVEAKGLPIGAPVPRPQPRAFTAPPSGVPGGASPPALPSAPEVATSSAPALSAALPAAPRPFLLPPGRPAASSSAAAVSLPDNAPALATKAPDASGDSAMAIVGLDPSKTAFPAPPGSRQAGFSAGPQPRADGGIGDSGKARIVVPGLTAQSGVKESKPTLVAGIAAPTSRESLRAAARMAANAPEPSIPTERAARVANAPDPRFEGRVIYTVAIQMPNVTSYSGSWLVWFAEREPLSGSVQVDMRPPKPLRKVDPKYIAAAAAERVEGKVRLSAVIRKNGHIDTVKLLQHLDSRLDRSAEEALAKWEFEPALRNGVPVDVDCVFEVPFLLAPVPPK